MFDGLLGKVFGRREEQQESQAKPAGGIPVGIATLGNSNFAQTIRKYPLTVVDFWAPWCAPCRAVSPVVDQLSKAYAGRVAFGKVNIDKEKWVASSYQIRSIPTIMLFSKGHTVARIVGAVPKSAIESKIKQHIAPGASSAGRR